MGNNRNKIGYLFSGGCHGCQNEIHICPGCCYMECDWTKPDLNTKHKTDLKEKERMVSKAKLAQAERGPL